MSARMPTEDPIWLKVVVLTLVLGFLALFLLLPLITVFVEALRHGVGPALEAIREPERSPSITSRARPFSSP